jgi:hypothetical protein
MPRRRRTSIRQEPSLDTATPQVHSHAPETTSTETASPVEHQVIQMQRQVGNQSVSRMLQTQRTHDVTPVQRNGVVQALFGFSAAEKKEKKRTTDYQSALEARERFNEYKYSFEEYANDKNYTFEKTHPKEAALIQTYEEIESLKKKLESALGSSGFWVGVWSFLGGKTKADEVSAEQGGTLTPQQEADIQKLASYGEDGIKALNDIGLLTPEQAEAKADELKSKKSNEISKAIKKLSTKHQLQIATYLSRKIGNGVSARGDAMQINVQDIQMEVFAHKIAYKGTTDGAIQEILDTWGYEKQFRRTVEGSGIFAGLIMPKNGSNAKPVMVFKGTNPKKASDIAADLDPIAVGFSTFQYHKGEIQSMLGEAGQKVLVTGHSLGGALAQHCVSAFPESVERLVTFQAPAISMAQALAFKLNKDKPSVTHHFAEGDVVDLAGGKHLDGEFFRHDPGFFSHTKFLLMAPEYAQARQQMGLTDEMLAKLNIKPSTNANPVERFESHPNWVMRFFAESLRTAVSPLGVIPWIAGFFQSNTVKLGDETIKNNAYAGAKQKFTDYKKKAEKPGWFSDAPGIKVGEVEKIIDKMIKSNPEYRSTAGGEGIAQAAHEILNIDLVLSEGRIIKFEKK